MSYRTGLPFVLGAIVSVSLLAYAAETRGIAESCCADFPIFEDAASAWFAGGPLYSHPVEDYAPGAGLYKFPPLTALVIAAGQLLLGRPIWAPVMAFHVLTYLVSAVLMLHTMRRLGATPLALAAFAVVVLSFGPFFETLFRLQLELPILVCLTIALQAMSRSSLAAGALLGLAAALKIYPLHLLPALLLLGKRRAAAAMVGSATLLTVASMVGVGEADSRHFTLHILPFMAREAPTDLFYAENVSLHRALGKLLNLGYAESRAVGDAVCAIVWLASVGALLARRAASPQLGVLLFVPVALLALPNSWVNYQLLLLPCLAWLFAEGLRGRRVALLCGGLAAGLLTFSWFESPYLGPPFLDVLRDEHPVVREAWGQLRVLATPLTWLGLLYCVVSRRSEARGIGNAAARAVE